MGAKRPAVHVPGGPCLWGVCGRRELVAVLWSGRSVAVSQAGRLYCCHADVFCVRFPASHMVGSVKSGWVRVSDG